MYTVVYICGIIEGFHMTDITLEIKLASSSLKYSQNKKKIRNNGITLIFKWTNKVFKVNN